MTRNGGRDWENVTPPAIQPYTRINIIDASPHDGATAFVAANRYQLDDVRPYIYKTSDYGKSWQAIASGLPERSFVRTVREDPNRRGLLYAGTETGVYFSLDGGGRWQSLQLNLPIVPITDLTVKDNDLIASTQGRAFWILDDVTPLHNLGEAMTTAMHLVAPRDAVRARRGGFGRAPGGAGQNRTRRRRHQLLARPRPGRDCRGRRRERCGGETRHQPRPQRPGRNPRVAPLHLGHALSGRARHRRRHVPGRRQLRGPIAVPGTYEVRLTAGETQRQPLRIVADARSQASAAELQEQFDLLIMIRDKVTAVHDAVNEIVKMRKTLASRRDPASMSSTRSSRRCRKSSSSCASSVTTIRCSCST